MQKDTTRSLLSLPLHQSATTVKGLTVEVNYMNRLITMNGSARKPLALEFMWVPVDTHNPPKNH